MNDFIIDVLCPFQQYNSYIVAVSFIEETGVQSEKCMTYMYTSPRIK
jgi:hypothetical protein